MNKLTKGSIAAGAGLVLLLGGAGTFMSWNSDESIAGGNVAAGYLEMEPIGAPTWTVNNESLPVDTTIDQFLIVPGDKVTYTANVKVMAGGNNLKANLSLDEASITAEDNEPSRQLEAYLVDGASYKLDAPTQGSKLEKDLVKPNTYSFASDKTGNTSFEETLTVTVDLTFPEVTTPESTAMRGNVTLNDLNVKFVQDTSTTAA